jgi:hypothetical protein
MRFQFPLKACRDEVREPADQRQPEIAVGSDPASGVREIRVADRLEPGSEMSPGPGAPLDLK